MGNGILVFLLIVVISAIIGAVSQMMKNAQAAAPPARRGARPRQSGDEIDKFLEEIDRVRKKKTSDDEPPVARPVARPVRQKAAPPPPPEPQPARRARASEGPEFVPSRVTRASDRKVEPQDDRSRPKSPFPISEPLPRLEDLPVAPPVAPAPSRTTVPAQTKSTRRVDPTEFASRMSGMLGGKDGLALALALQEILNPPKCKR